MGIPCLVLLPSPIGWSAYTGKRGKANYIENLFYLQ
jgi:hypothetical protein